MPKYVDPAVDRLRDSDAETTVTVLLGVEGDRERVVDGIERAGASVEGTLGRATVRATTPECAIDDLCSVEGVSSIELERNDVRTLEEGNGDSRRRVIR